MGYHLITREYPAISADITVSAPYPELDAAVEAANRLRPILNEVHIISPSGKIITEDAL